MNERKKHLFIYKSAQQNNKFIIKLQKLNIPNLCLRCMLKIIYFTKSMYSNCVFRKERARFLQLSSFSFLLAYFATFWIASIISLSLSLVHLSDFVLVLNLDDLI